MARICQVTGKKTNFGNRIARRGLAKKKGGVGIKITGITARKFQVNLQRIKVLLPDGTVKRMRVAASVIRAGWILAKVDGRMQRVPLVKAVRGRNRQFQAPKEEAAAGAAAAAVAAAEAGKESPQAETPPEAEAPPVSSEPSAPAESKPDTATDTPSSGS